MQLLTPTHFTDYELLDCGDFEKLERFGKYILIRPEPQAVWPKVYSTAEWEKLAHIKFIPKSSSSGEWKKIKQMPDQWDLRYTIGGESQESRDKSQESRHKSQDSGFRIQDTGFKSQESGFKIQDTGDEELEIRNKSEDSRNKIQETRFKTQNAGDKVQGTEYKLHDTSYKVHGTNLTFRLGLTSFKHVGIFPEQAVNWDKIYSFLHNKPKAKFLNLFAYTGGASVAAKAAGADVTHVDSIKQVVTWANENMQKSKLDNIRWVVDDALKFVRKEIRRGNVYQGIILDPPAFGHGPNGEKWKLEDNIKEMMESVLQILDTNQHLLILNAYSLGFSALVPENLLTPFAKKNKSELSIGELYLNAKSGIKLPLGVWGSLKK